MEIPLPREISNVEVALVLGGGGVRGAAHVGVIEVLEKAGVPIHMIVGCSAGAIVGSLYADKQDYNYLKDAILQATRDDILDFTFQNMLQGPVRGNKLEKFMYRHLKHKNLEELSLPMVILATDLIEGKEVWLNSGPIAPSVVASSALPPLFSPKKLYGKTLVDGGVLAVVPVTYAKQCKARLIIAVDVSSRLPESQPKHILGVTKRSFEIALTALSKMHLDQADIVISPKVDQFGMFEDRAEEIYQRGIEAAKTSLPSILQQLEAQGIALSRPKEAIVF